MKTPHFPAMAPTTAKPPGKKNLRGRGNRTARISFSCSEDEKAAILRLARHVMRKPGQAVACIVREHLIHSPAEVTCSAFDPEKSLELWVWANIVATKRNEPPVLRSETLVRSNDGKNIIRLDWRTAA